MSLNPEPVTLLLLGLGAMLLEKENKLFEKAKK